MDKAAVSLGARFEDYKGVFAPAFTAAKDTSRNTIQTSAHHYDGRSVESGAGT